MNIEFLGQAGLYVQTNNCSLLCDPWFSKTGGFLASWHQFPSNENIDTKKFDQAAYLFISHLHHDHYDKEFLKTISKDIQVIIANYTTKKLRDELVELGFTRVLELDDWKKTKLADNFEIMIVTDPGKYKEDSSLMINAEGFRILNKNDCYLSDEYMRHPLLNNVDLLFTQFSGAIWYPMVYEYDKKKKKQLSKEVRRRLVDSFVHVVNSIKPHYVVPCAGPPCFLDDSLFENNFLDNGIFYDQNDLVNYLDGSLGHHYNCMLPGDYVELSNGLITFYNENKFNFSEKREILKDYQRKRTSYISNYLNEIPEVSSDLFPLFSNYMKKLSGRSKYLASNIQQLIEFNVEGKNGGVWQVDFRNSLPVIHDSPVASPQYTFWIDSRFLNLIISDQLLWEELFLSMRFKAFRKPDIYNWALFTLLTFGHNENLLLRAENAELLSKSPQTINVKNNHKMYKIQRYCPHMGEDLHKGTIKNGIVICSRHRWKFDLEQGGKCISGGQKDLRIYTTSDLEEEEDSGCA